MAVSSHFGSIWLWPIWFVADIVVSHMDDLNLHIFPIFNQSFANESQFLQCFLVLFESRTKLYTSWVRWKMGAKSQFLYGGYSLSSKFDTCKCNVPSFRCLSSMSTIFPDLSGCQLSGCMTIAYACKRNVCCMGFPHYRVFNIFCLSTRVSFFRIKVSIRRTESLFSCYRTSLHWIEGDLR